MSYMASVGADSRGRRVELEVAARLSRAKQAGDVGERIDLAAVPSSRSQAVGDSPNMQIVVCQEKGMVSELCPTEKTLHQRSAVV